MSERVRITAEDAEKLAIRIMTYARKVHDNTNKLANHYGQNSGYWRDSKAQLFQNQLTNIIHHSTQATEIFYKYGEMLYDKVQNLRR